MSGYREGGQPRLPDFSEREKMTGEYQVIGIYPRGLLMEFVRPSLGPNVLTKVDVERLEDGSAYSKNRPLGDSNFLHYPF